MLVKILRYASGLCVVLSDDRAAFSINKIIFLPTNSLASKGAPVVSKPHGEMSQMWSGYIGSMVDSIFY